MTITRDIFRALVMTMLAVLVTTTAQAQINEQRTGVQAEVWRTRRYTPRQNPDEGHLSPAERARLELDQFGECVVHGNRKGVDRFLSEKLDSPGYENAAKRVMVDECIEEGNLKLTTDLVRGAMFRNLYRIDFAKKESIVPGPAQNYSSDFVDPANAVASSHVALLNFADCVVRADPATARALVLGIIASANEAKAMAAIGPSLSACMNKGVQLTFSKAVLVGKLSEALYRTSHAAVAIAVAH